MGARILLIGNHPPPFGGVPSHIEGLASHLSHRKWDVHVLSLVPPSRRTERVGDYLVHRPSKPARIRELLWAMPTLPPKGWSAYAVQSPKRLLATIALANLITRMVRRYDIGVMSAYHLLPSALAAAWVSRIQAVPLVTSVFGEIYADPELHRKRLNELRYIIDSSRRLLSCSQHCANSFRAIGLTPPVEVVYYGVDTRRFSPVISGSAIRRRLGISDQDPIVLFVGRMHPEMGLQTLLQAMPEAIRAVPAARFLVVGARGEVSATAERLSRQLPNHLFVEPDVATAELPYYYAAASIVVAPSINARACLGLAIAEGMASGKPVIGCRVGGTSEILSDGETGVLVRPENAAALTEAIVHLLLDEETRGRMGKRGREVAETRFDQDQTNIRLERLFSELCNG